LTPYCPAVSTVEHNIDVPTVIEKRSVGEITHSDGKFLVIKADSSNETILQKGIIENATWSNKHLYRSNRKKWTIKQALLSE